MEPRVLLADDDEGVASVVRRALLPGGCRVTSAANAEEALSRAVETPPDLILLDVGLPDRSGWEVLDGLRANPATRLVPVIMLTGRATDGDKEEGFARGADDYVVKPFSPRELLARVLGRLSRQREAMSVSPLTGLPGTPSVQAEVEARLAAGRPFCLLHADIDRFKSYNDAYGYERGDAAIKAAGSTLAAALREAGDAGALLGHIGGDDFVLVCDEDKGELAAAFAVMRFDEAVVALYDDRDRARGWVETLDRRGQARREALMSLSIGGVSSTRSGATSYADAARRADEMKAWLKSGRAAGPSLWAFDRRRGGEP